jgi:hypothetical protein
MSCSRNALRAAGIVPSQSGNRKTMCSDEAIASRAGSRPGGRTPLSNSVLLWIGGTSRRAMSTRVTP